MLSLGRVPLPVGRAGFKPPRNNAESMRFLANGGPGTDWISMGYHPLWKNCVAPLLRPKRPPPNYHRRPFAEYPVRIGSPSSDASLSRLPEVHARSVRT